MGHHLHLYATKSLTLAELESWSEYRANDDVASPEPVDEKVEAEMHVLNGTHSPDTFCDRHVLSEFKKETFVWHPFRYDNSFVTLMQKLYPAEIDLFDWLRAHIGWLVWGDNDGI